MPRAPNTAPITAPPTVDATTYAVTVLRQDAPRPRSPSGVMLASIDSPQGDQVARTPAAADTARPTTRSSASRDNGVVRWSVETGMAHGYARVQELGVDAGRVVAPLDVDRCRRDGRRGGRLPCPGARAGGSVRRRLGQQSAHRRPVGSGALTSDATGRPVDIDEVRRPGDLVGLPR